MLEANAGMRPSLAVWDFRRLDEDVPAHGGNAVAAAEGTDEHLLSVIEHQAKVAAVSLRHGHGQKAVSVLRRAFRMAEGHSCPPEPIARLAIALVKIQLCIALSQLGRHEQALSEASQAKHEADEIWKILTEANEVLAEADAVGDPTRPEPLLKRILRNPPRWLNRVVEATVQSRQAMALEMEFLLVAAGEDVNAPAVAPVREGMPVRKLTMVEDMHKLHEEASNISRQLLAEDSEVRSRTELAQVEAGERWEVRMRTPGRASQNNSLKRPTVLQPVAYSRPATSISSTHFLEAPEELPALRDKFHPKRLHTAGSVGFDHGQEFSLSVPSTASTFAPGLGSLNVSGSEWYKTSMASMNSSAGFSALSREEQVPTLRTCAGHPTAPRGDVRVHSFMRSRTAPSGLASPEISAVLPHAPSAATAGGKGGNTGKRGLSRQRSQSPQHDRVVEGSFITCEQNEPNRNTDPFSDWKNTVSSDDVSRMSLLQLTVRTTADGPRKVQDSLSLQNRRFKSIDMNRQVQDELSDYRQLYCKHGMVALRKKGKLLEKWKAESWQPSSRTLHKKEERMQAFQHFGIQKADVSSMGDLKKLFKEVQHRSPEETQRREREIEEQRQADLERREREREALKSQMVGFGSAA